MNRDPKFYRVTAAAVFFSRLGLALGFWQLDRAAQKEALQAAMHAQAGKVPWDNAAVLALAAQGRMQESGVLYHPVRLEGTWLPAHTVYLDNRQMDAKVGFFVLTPLRLEPQGQLLVVQRGWIPRNFEQRAQLPEVQRLQDWSRSMATLPLCLPSSMLLVCLARGRYGKILTWMNTGVKPDCR